jgi:hypothetical protein
MLTRLVAQVLIAIATAGPLLSCPIGKIAHAARAPLDSYKKTAVEAREVRSTEGGAWYIYHKADGALHSIVRVDYGETGQFQMRASFLDRRTLGIIVTRLRYDAPISPYRSVRIVERTSTEFFFCDGSHVGFLQANPRDDASALAAIREAKGEKSMLFDSEEIAPYLEGLKVATPDAASSHPLGRGRKAGQTRRV